MASHSYTLYLKELVKLKQHQLKLHAQMAKIQRRLVREAQRNEELRTTIFTREGLELRYIEAGTTPERLGFSMLLPLIRDWMREEGIPESKAVALINFLKTRRRRIDTPPRISITAERSSK